jgi:hypothetical protein
MGNPSGLHDGEMRSCHLMFNTNSNGYTQTVTVPVILIKGNMFQRAYTGPQPRLLFQYLPTIWRKTSAGRPASHLRINGR